MSLKIHVRACPRPLVAVRQNPKGHGEYILPTSQTSAFLGALAQKLRSNNGQITSERKRNTRRSVEVITKLPHGEGVFDIDPHWSLPAKHFMRSIRANLDDRKCSQEVKILLTKIAPTVGVFKDRDDIDATMQSYSLSFREGGKIVSIAGPGQKILEDRHVFHIKRKAYLSFQIKRIDAYLAVHESGEAKADTPDPKGDPMKLMTEISKTKDHQKRQNLFSDLLSHRKKLLADYERPFKDDVQQRKSYLIKTKGNQSRDIARQMKAVGENFTTQGLETPKRVFRRARIPRRPMVDQEFVQEYETNIDRTTKREEKNAFFEEKKSLDKEREIKLHEQAERRAAYLAEEAVATKRQHEQFAESKQASLKSRQRRMRGRDGRAKAAQGGQPKNPGPNVTMGGGSDSCPYAFTPGRGFMSLFMKGFEKLSAKILENFTPAQVFWGSIAYVVTLMLVSKFISIRARALASIALIIMIYLSEFVTVCQLRLVGIEPNPGPMCAPPIKPELWDYSEMILAERQRRFDVMRFRNRMRRHRKEKLKQKTRRISFCDHFLAWILIYGAVVLIFNTYLWITGRDLASFGGQPKNPGPKQGRGSQKSSVTTTISTLEDQIEDARGARDAYVDLAAENGSKCAFCNGRHDTENCEVALAKDRLEASGKCIVCGSHTHKSEDCERKSHQFRKDRKFDSDMRLSNKSSYSFSSRFTFVTDKLDNPLQMSVCHPEVQSWIEKGTTRPEAMTDTEFYVRTTPKTQIHRVLGLAVLCLIFMLAIVSYFGIYDYNGLISIAITALLTTIAITFLPARHAQLPSPMLTDGMMDEPSIYPRSYADYQKSLCGYYVWEARCVPYDTPTLEADYRLPSKKEELIAQPSDCRFTLTRTFVRPTTEVQLLTTTPSLLMHDCLLNQRLVDDCYQQSLSSFDVDMRLTLSLIATNRSHNIDQEDHREASDYAMYVYSRQMHRRCRKGPLDPLNLPPPPRSLR